MEYACGGKDSIPDIPGDEKELVAAKTTTKEEDKHTELKRLFISFSNSPAWEGPNVVRQIIIINFKGVISKVQVALVPECRLWDPTGEAAQLQGSTVREQTFLPISLLLR